MLCCCTFNRNENKKEYSSIDGLKGLEFYGKIEYMKV